jgi:hypothetical protein
MSAEHLDARAARDLGSHCRRRLDREDSEVEPVAERGGERAGPRPDVHHGHARRRPEMPPDCLAPRPEPVSRDLADRLKCRRGLIVVADPDYPVPPYVPAVYRAGIIAALDLLTMLGLFMGFRPELSPPARNPKPVPPR